MTRRLSLTAVLLVLAAPGVAPAQDDGVFVDPDSPTGKEYAIPLEEARRQASSSDDAQRTAPGQRTAPLFGEGVEAGDGDADAASPAAGGDQSGSGSSGGSDSGSRSGSGGGSSAPSVDTDELSGTGSPARGSNGVTVAEASSDFSSTPAVAGLAVAVLLLGGVLGSVLRRRPLT